MLMQGLRSSLARADYASAMDIVASPGFASQVDGDELNNLDPHHILMDVMMSALTPDEQATVISLLLKAGADPFGAVMEDNYSVLHIAAQKGNLDVITMLLNAGMSPVLYSATQVPAYCFAVLHPTAFQYLLDAVLRNLPPDFTRKDVLYYGVVMACVQGVPASLSLLLEGYKVVKHSLYNLDYDI